MEPGWINQGLELQTAHFDACLFPQEKSQGGYTDRLPGGLGLILKDPAFQPLSALP